VRISSTAAGAIIGLLGLTLTPGAAQAADAPTIDAVVQVGQVVDYSFPCAGSTSDRWFRDGVLIDGQVINTYTVRAQDLGTQLSVERTCAGTGETMTTPESGVVTSSGSQVPVIGTLTRPPTGQAFLNSPDAQSSVVGDPTDPGVDLFVGQLASDDQTLVDPSTLTVAVAAVQKGQRVPPVDATGVSVSATGSVRHVSFEPTQRGNVTLVFTVTGTTGEAASYSLDYYASAATTPTSRVLQATSDASTAIAAGEGYLFVADDEIHQLRLYDGEVSGLPVAVFSPGTSTGEDDYESSARTGDSVFWLGAHGNSKAGEVQPGRQVVYETTISGSGANATLTPVGKYNGLRNDLIAWDQANGNRYGFAAAAALGQVPDGPAQFNIEASEFAPDGSTLYLGFRGPLTGRVAGGRALIVPVTNIKQLTRGQATKATFGPPIEYDLGGHSLREIRKNAAGEYLLLTADAVPHNSSADVKRDQLLWYWDGQPQTMPEKLTTVVPHDVEECYGTTGAWEGIGELPDDLTNGAQVRLIMDQGYVCPYSPSGVGMTAEEQQAKWESTQQKDISADQLRKARTDVVTLTGAMGVGASVTGSGAFGEERAGASSAARPVTVTNTGAKPLTISQVSLTDEDGVSAQDFRVDDAACLGETLAVGATCEAQARFVPARTGAASTATLQVTASGGTPVGSLALTGSSPAVFAIASTPTISNLSPTVGDTLTSSTPAWTPVAAFSYLWLRDGQPVGGAVSASYAVTDADVGHRISVTVTGTAAGLVPESKTSAPTGVVAARATPVLPIQQVVKYADAAVSIKALTKRRVQVRVRAKGVPAALLTQTITVKIAGVAKAYRVELVRGRATIRLAGARAAGVKTGQPVRVSVRVPKLAASLTRPGAVTTYLVARTSRERTVVVRS
jgi:hypothetical protein